MFDLFSRWGKRSKLSVIPDVPRSIADWFDRIGRSSPPADGIVALNIGIFETPNGYTIYLTGSTEYDPDNDDWACREDYSPKERYFELPSEFTSGKDWKEVEEDLKLLIRNILSSDQFANNVLAKTEVFAVGFDDGDLTRLK